VAKIYIIVIIIMIIFKDEQKKSPDSLGRIGDLKDCSLQNAQKDTYLANKAWAEDLREAVS
jgi:hypothetical protein